MPHEAGRVTDPNRVSRERAVDATRSISPRVWNDRYAFVPIMPQDRGFGAELDERCRFPHLADAAGRSPGRHSRLDGASLRRGDSFRSPTPNTRPLVSRVGEGTASLSSGNAAHLQPSGGISTTRGRAGTIRGKDALTSALRSASRAPAAPAHSGSADCRRRCRRRSRARKPAQRPWMASEGPPRGNIQPAGEGSVAPGELVSFQLL